MPKPTDQAKAHAMVFHSELDKKQAAISGKPAQSTVGSVLHKMNEGSGYFGDPNEKVNRK